MLDEPCLLLVEMNLKTPDQRERHRYQIIHVIRNDKPAEIRLDLGKEDDRVNQFRIPGGFVLNNVPHIEHTVGELQEIAHQIRGRPAFKTEDIPDLDKWRDQKDRTKRLIFS